MSKKLRSYPKVWNLGHPQVADLFRGKVWIQEKIDGSQFSFGVVDNKLHMRSKRSDVYLESAGKLFKKATKTATELFEKGLLEEGYIYRGEAVCSPKHNTISYETAPDTGLILFDIDVGLEDRVRPDEAASMADELGVPFTPLVFVGEVDSFDELKEMYNDHDPFLGGDLVEGLVIKNYNEFDYRSGKQLMGKYVSKEFREKHDRSWNKRNPGKKEVVAGIIHSLTTEARWRKAIQHLKEDGDLQQAPQDIGPIIKEIQKDVLEEEEEWIKEELYKNFRDKIRKGVVRGFPEWYKDLLLEGQKFND